MSQGAFAPFGCYCIECKGLTEYKKVRKGNSKATTYNTHFCFTTFALPAQKWSMWAVFDKVTCEIKGEGKSQWQQ